MSLDYLWKDEYVGPAFWYPIAFGNPAVEPLESYGLLNFALQYRPAFASSDGKRPITFSLSGRNLTDEKVFETLVGLEAQTVGREIIFGITYDFID